MKVHRKASRLYCCTNLTPVPVTTTTRTVSDCRDARRGSGLYRIDPGEMGDKQVHCDMSLAGGGWMVLLRMDGSENFTHSWLSSRNRVGTFIGEFLAGIEFMHRITSVLGKTYQLRCDMTSSDNGHRYAEYDRFRVGDESLHIGCRSGNTEEPLTFQEQPTP